MDWINFISDHPGRLFFPRIGRSLYTGASRMSETTTSSTLFNWFRETENQISIRE
jgi:hypothetical protein